MTTVLPNVPRRRYNIFAGTNRRAEWWAVARALVLRRRLDDRAVIDEYERAFAGACGAAHAISFGAGRMALYAILEALGIGAGDEVIIPAFTCVVVPNAILYRGATPVYVDIDARSFNIDTSAVEAAITPRTRALYAQHTFGVPCDVEALRALGRRYGLPVIEDGAHALGAVYHGQPVGSLTEVAFFSTDHSKVISTHLGGVAVTSDAAIADRLRALQERSPHLDSTVVRRILFTFLIEYLCFAPAMLWFGRLVHVALIRLGLLFFFDDELKTRKPAGYPYPCRLSSVQAEIGLSQLRDLPRNLAHRRAIAAWMEERVRWYGFSPAEMAQPTWLRYSFLVRERGAIERVFARRFDLGIWFTSVVGGRRTDLASVGYHPGSCPTAEFVADHIVNVPTHARVPLAVLQEAVVTAGSLMTPTLSPAAEGL